MNDTDTSEINLSSFLSLYWKKKEKPDAAESEVTCLRLVCSIFAWNEIFLFFKK